MSLLVAKNLSKQYGNKLVINNFSYVFPKRGMVAIMGQSGVGKSTLLHLLAGMEKAEQGDVYYQNQALNQLSRRQLTGYHRYAMSIIFQNHYLFEYLSVEENLYLALKIKGYQAKESKDLINFFLHKFNLDYLAKHKVHTLSGGEKSRISIMRAIIHQPPLIFADEPTGALDEQTAMEIMDILSTCAQQSLVIFVTHNEKIARAYATQIINLNSPRTYQQNWHFIESSIVAPKLAKRSDKSLTFLLIKSRVFQQKTSTGFTIGALSLAFFATIFTLGFNQGVHKFAQNLPYQYLDMNTALVQEVHTVEMYNSPLVLSRVASPSKDVLEWLSNKYPNITYRFNYDYIINQHLKVSYGQHALEEIEVVTIDKWRINPDREKLLVSGVYPSQNDAIVINQEANRYLLSTIEEDGQGKFLDFSLGFQLDIPHPKKNDEIIIDTLDKTFSLEIKGIIQEASLLETPKIFLTQDYLETLVQSPMINMSEIIQKDITWEEYLNTEEDAGLFNYAQRIIFPDRYIMSLITDIQNYQIAENTKLDFINSGASGIKTFQSLQTFLNMAFQGFLIISLAGVLAIICIITFAKLVTNKKHLAILRSLGASDYQLLAVFICESALIITASLLTLVIIPNLLQYINPFLLKLTGIKEAIVVPWRLLNFEYGLIIGLGVITFVVFVMIIKLTFNYFSRQIILKELISE
ncbi:MAG: ATP-binding cassette domain-containing protein [Bacilli bacterium]|jgi:ABC-type lipoprotein export system ATPase subunit/ABC-type antimicrobial peptide transport system permease subunit|nr:ATP-binding cassette domain-containing protein [Bacilli bacterium]MDY0399569.1 ATP-binding cassette domain-containing protein [Bacilli bacterium]